MMEQIKIGSVQKQKQIKHTISCSRITIEHILR